MKIASLMKIPIKKVSVTIPYLLYLNLFKIVENCSIEIGMLLEVEKTKTNNELEYTLKSFILPKQTMTAMTCTLQADSELDLLYKAETNGMNIDNIRCWLHSHVNMGVFASGTDQNTFDKLASDVNDFYMMIVVNKKEEFFVKILDKEEQLLMEEVPVYILYPKEVMSDEEAKKQIAEAKVVESIAYKGNDRSFYMDNIMETKQIEETKHSIGFNYTPITREQYLDEIEMLEYDLFGIATRYTNKTPLRDLKEIYKKLNKESEEIKRSEELEMIEETGDWRNHANS